jgi:cyclopropane-fatty-acyl-phospholipid synthase
MVTRVSHQEFASDTPDLPDPAPVADRKSDTTGGGPDRFDRTSPLPVADALGPVIRALVGKGTPVRFEFWDGSGIGPTDGAGTVHVRSADALRRILWSPGELGVARAFVAGDLTLDGDLFALLRVLHDASPRQLRQLGVRTLPTVIDAARRLGALGPPLPNPPEECRPAGRIHSPTRDARAISHHYDVGNDFYRLVLGPSMTYSCARFATEDTTLHEAQAAKHELICRKLGLDQRPGMRLLDVGCGWGSMALHAARHHKATVTGVALSREQVGEANRRVIEAGLDDRIEIRLQDYRDLHGESFDAISSIGMFEHVGTPMMTRYFDTLRGLLVPTGRLMNHAISKPGGSVLGRRSFIGRYVFPDGELLDVADVIRAMQQSGFEVRDVESLREHYSRTLHHLAALHGRVGQRLRRRRSGHPPGAGRHPRVRGTQRHAVHAGGMGLTATRQSAGTT